MRLAFVILITILSHTAFTGSRITVSLYALKLDASPFTVGVLMSLYAMLPMLLSVGSGRLIDRIGPRAPMLWGSLALVAGVAMPFALPGLETLFVSASLIGSGFMLVHLVANNMVGAFGKSEDRAANFSWLALGFSVSGFLGPLVAGFGIDLIGHTNTFLLLAAFSAVALGLALWRRHGFNRHAVPKTETAGHRVMDLVHDRRLRAAFIASGLLSMGWDLYTFVIPIHGSNIGLSASTIGIIMSVFAAATFAVRLFMPLVARRLKEWQVIAAAMLISGCAYSLFPFVTSAPLLMAISFLLGVGLGCSQPMVMALLYAASPAGRQGEVIGVRTTVLNASHTVLPLVFGALGSALGMGPVFWAMSAFLLTGGYSAGRKAVRQG